MISKKELFERLISLETKTDLVLKEGSEKKRLFQGYVYLIIILLILNMAMTGVIMVKLVYEF